MILVFRQISSKMADDGVSRSVSTIVLDVVLVGGGTFNTPAVVSITYTFISIVYKHGATKL